MTTRPTATQSNVERLDTGIVARDRKSIADSLQPILVSSYELLLETHLVHWNVVGPLFAPVHELTEKQYEAIFANIDELAERIRILGRTTPDDARRGMRLEAALPADPSDIDGLLEGLIRQHEAIGQDMRKAADTAEEEDDIVTNDLLVRLITFHEKAIWMLRSSKSQPGTGRK